MILSVRKYILFAVLSLFSSYNVCAQTSIAISFESNNGLNYLVEGCTENMDVISFKLDQPASSDLKFATNISGSATINMDYIIALPDTIEFLQGDDSLGYVIISLTDAITEGLEELTISAMGNGMQGSIHIDIKEEFDINFADGANLELCANGTVYTVATDGPNNMEWTSDLDISVAPDNQSATINANEAGTIQVIGTLGTCVDTSIIQVSVINPTLTLNIDGDTEICTGENTILTAVLNEPDYQTINWEGAGSQGSNPLVFTVNPTEDTKYIAEVQYSNCPASDSVIIQYDEFYFPTLLIGDTICQNAPTQITSSVNLSSTNYDWTPGTYLMDSTHPFPYIIATDTTTPLSYKLVAVSNRGFCADSFEHVITEILPAEMEIDARDTVYLCLGDSITLDAITSEEPDSINWTSTHSVLNVSRGDTIQTKPEVSTTIVATQHFTNGCILYDTVFLRVDSLPTDTLRMDPMIPECGVFCPLDTVRLFSDSIDYVKFPDIKFEWFPESEPLDTNINFDAYIVTNSPRWYVREVTQNACTKRDSIFVPVDVTSIPVNITDTILCYGDEVNFIADVTDVHDIMWTAEPEGSEMFLSCTDCPNPTMTGIPVGGPQSIKFTIQGKSDTCECPVGSELTVRVPVPNVTISPNATSHLVGSDTTLTVTISPTVTESDIQWTYEGSVLNPPVFGFTNEVNVPRLGENNYGVIVDVNIDNDNTCQFEFGSTLIGTPPPEPYIPNVFSPNGDNMNDFFAPLVAAMGAPIPAGSIEDFKIFSRWGQLVYDNDSNASGWNGKIDGDDAPADVYVYILEVISGSTTTVYKGDVTLVR